MLSRALLTQHVAYVQSPRSCSPDLHTGGSFSGTSLEGKLEKCSDFGFFLSLSQNLCEKLAWAWFRLDDSNHRQDSEDERGIYYIRTARQAPLCRFRVGIMSGIVHNNCQIWRLHNHIIRSGMRRKVTLPALEKGGKLVLVVPCVWLSRQSGQSGGDT